MVIQMTKKVSGDKLVSDDMNACGNLARVYNTERNVPETAANPVYRLNALSS